MVVLIIARQTDDPSPFQVDYATQNQEAQSGSDYVSAAGTLLFAEGEQAQAIELEILNDSQREERESFQVQLHNAQGMIIALGTAEVSIRDNDPGIYFQTPYVEVSEEEPLVELTVWRGSDDLRPFTVDYATFSRIPPEGGDYQPVSGTLI